MWGVNTDDEDNLIQNAFDNIGNEDSDIVSSKDIDFVFECMAKEAPFDKQSIKQIFYGMVSAFTKVVIHHAISSKNAGAGKTYLLVLVAGYMPRQYVIPLNGMSDKAMLHKAGSMVVEMEDGEIKLLDALIDAIEEDKDKIQEELDYTLNNGNKEDIKRLKKSLKDKDNEIKDLKSKAEKLIILENRIVLLLDTTQDGVFSALMSMASQDTKEDQKYEFVDSNGSTIGTRSNRFRGIPSIFICQVIDDTRQARYAEKNRRFIHVIPDTSNDKIRTAMNSMAFKYGLIPEEYDTLVLNSDDKDRAQKICKKLIEKLIDHSKYFTTKESGIKVFFPLSISQSIAKNPTDVWGMTIVDRIFKYLTAITTARMDSRPKLIDTVVKGKFYPIATFEDLREALDLMGLVSSTLRPYIVDWYNRVFLPAYQSLGGQTFENKTPKGYVISKEASVGVNTKILSEKTAEVMKVAKLGSKDLLQQYLYPLLNLGIIDKTKSTIDERTYIYYPVEEGTIHTLFSNSDDKRLEVFDPTYYPSRSYIEEFSRTLMEYSSKDGGVDNKKYKIVSHDGRDITLSELIDEYLNNPEIAFKESENNSVPPQAWKNNLTESSKTDTEESSNMVTKEPNGGNYERKGFTNMYVCKDCNLCTVEYAIKEHVCPAWTEQQSTKERQRQTELNQDEKDKSDSC